MSSTEREVVSLLDVGGFPGLATRSRTTETEKREKLR
jgi:hypothetical protein